MARVEIADDTFHALQRIASGTGSELDALVECALSPLIELERLSDDEWLRRWDAVIARIRAGVPEGITAEDIDRDLDAAIAGCEVVSVRAFLEVLP